MALALQRLLGGVELNPGPARVGTLVSMVCRRALSIGVHIARSAIN